MDSKVRSLINEVRQIKAQYQAEVGRARKPWPVSIQQRVIKLLELGLPPGEVTAETGISYHSVLKWRKENGLPFRQVATKKAKGKFHSLMVTDQVRKLPASAGETEDVRLVTVLVGSGIKVNLTSAKEAAHFVALLIKEGSGAV